jgi:hypothetical protein
MEHKELRADKLPVNDAFTAARSLKTREWRVIPETVTLRNRRFEATSPRGHTRTTYNRKVKVIIAKIL